jgi:hypothetical protein
MHKCYQKCLASLKAKTLVHKAAMPTAVHAVRTFGAAAGGAYTLELHSDGSLDDADFKKLETAAQGVETRRVERTHRQRLLAPQIFDKPECRSLFSRPSYMTKLEVLAYEPGPFFYFDSDIVWLHPFEPITSPIGQAIFSTETWSWYYGIQKSGVWIKERIPRRINSGFAYLPGVFPFDRLETMLKQGLYTPDHRFSTDQELLAYLYPDCRIFSLDDFSRSRRGRRYNLCELKSVALHFPGGMWKEHLGEIAAFSMDGQNARRNIQTVKTTPLSPFELLRMYGALICDQHPLLHRLANRYRRMRS